MDSMSTEQVKPLDPANGSAAAPDRRLRLLRALWLATFALIVALYLVGLPLFYGQMLAAAKPSNEALADPALPAILAEAGISAQTYAVYKLIVVLSGFSLVVVAAIIFWRRNYDRSAVVISYLLLLAGTGDIPALALSLAGQAGIWLGRVLTMVSANAMTLLFFLFPTAYFVPRWTRWVALFFFLVTLPSFVAPGSQFDLLGGPVGFILVFPILGSFIYAQVYRYRRVSGPVERLQSRWAMLGLLALPLSWAIHWVLLFVAPSFDQISADTITTRILLDIFLFQPLVLLFPIGVGIAILRYRLYDIDVVIRKTLVYSVLTVLLALVYFGVVIVLQGLFGRLAGVAEGSTLAVVISTLAIAALFTPLRRRIQDGIDRRFYRKKYNAQQVLAQFAQTARDETDLDALLAELVRVVDETLQPEHVSVLLFSVKPATHQTSSVETTN